MSLHVKPFFVSAYSLHRVAFTKDQLMRIQSSDGFLGVRIVLPQWEKATGLDLKKIIADELSTDVSRIALEVLENFRELEYVRNDANDHRMSKYAGYRSRVTVRCCLGNDDLIAKALEKRGDWRHPEGSTCRKVTVYDSPVLYFRVTQSFPFPEVTEA